MDVLRDSFSSAVEISAILLTMTLGHTHRFTHFILSDLTISHQDLPFLSVLHHLEEFCGNDAFFVPVTQNDSILASPELETGIQRLLNVNVHQNARAVPHA